MTRLIGVLLFAALALAARSGSGSAASPCPAANPPNELLLAAGSAQTAQLGKQFPSNLQAQLANSNGCPLTGSLAGVAVTFDAPAGGPSGIFAGSGSREAVVGTDAEGLATAPAFTADDLAGGYTVEARSQYGTVAFDLANTAGGVAAAVSAADGANQQATVDSQYALPLQARVTDANGNPVQGASVSFSIVPGPTGAGASFLGNAQAGATTNSNGLATSPPLLANAVPGRFTAVASTDGLAPVAAYALDNHAANEALTAATAGAQSATIDSRYARPLTVRLHDASGQPVEGAVITFTLGLPSADGPAATFDGGANQATALTDAKGAATSPRFTANGTPGDFTATAASAGVAAPLTFALRNLPANIAVSKRTARATVGTGYRQRVVATVRARNGKPIDGVSVTFTISSSSTGASATFPDGSKQATVLTGAGGNVASPRLLANTTAGRFTVAAAIGGTTRLAGCTLRNVAGRASRVTAGVASGESTALRQQFPVPLAVTVGDRYGNPVAGASVEFTAPPGGASGRFTGTRHPSVADVRTSARGIAVAPAFRANDVAGGYVVSAAVRGTGAHASFALVNTPR